MDLKTPEKGAEANQKVDQLNTIEKDRSDSIQESFVQPKFDITVKRNNDSSAGQTMRSKI